MNGFKRESRPSDCPFAVLDRRRCKEEDDMTGTPRRPSLVIRDGVGRVRPDPQAQKGGGMGIGF